MSATESEDGVPDAAVPHEEPPPNRAPLPLLGVFIALLLATVWLVVLPALDNPTSKPPARPCDSFIVSKSGSARCVDAPVSASQDPGAQPATAYP
jgi:hypothetical protein